MDDAYYFLVSGRVQGVSFRASTRDMARALGVRGWVRNRSDGCVEGVAYGRKAALNELHDWLRTGPAAAQVERVVLGSATAIQAEADHDFVIR